ncbi:MAG TPA: hypothetical protein VMZ27_10765 [Candidatus Saccharimonadales bacterium]|nr:hypothetical protein [Candidatus Saccharimonadales bacterium]
MHGPQETAERQRLKADASRAQNWKRWGPYLSERQWATIREDYSEDGNPWTYFPHDHARSRAYRWGEDGLLGISDRECRLCFALALWNGHDPILKERLFGLTGPQGNHGEDVKEEYFYLDSTPTHSYMKALYKYPQGEFPYARLVEENRNRGRNQPEFELADTGAFEGNRYFDVFAEYAKQSPDDILIRITVANRGPAKAVLHLLPTLWFKNSWTWGERFGEGTNKPSLERREKSLISARHDTLEEFLLAVGPDPKGAYPPLLFTENETNNARLFGVSNGGPFVKDAFHEHVVHGREGVVNPKLQGTKAAAHYILELAPGEEQVIRLRLFSEQEGSRASAVDESLRAEFDEIFGQRKKEADEFYSLLSPPTLEAQSAAVIRQGYAGLMWNKQFYYYVVQEWLEGDLKTVPPPANRKEGRNHEWRHLYSKDIISMPDNWEYPWFAGWDLAFHMIPFARADPDFAKQQLVMLLREWYMHPNGQLPAYEFAFDDVNPPVHAWAAWRVYKMAAPCEQRDYEFLERVFQKLLLNFTWWVNRKDPLGNNIFAGGFLGLDNIGVFDRSKPLPTGGSLQQSDGTARMAFYCATMLSIAIELARKNGRLQPAYEDMASKFFEHFVQIVDAMNGLGGTGLWDEQDGFYYDQLLVNGVATPLRVRSLVGLLPMIVVEVLEEAKIRKLPGFSKRLDWFLKHRQDLSQQITYCNLHHQHEHRLLSVPSKERLVRLLRYMLDEQEFLSPFGIRSVSKYHEQHPFVYHANGDTYQVGYEPGESQTGLFGGNSNWRGPIWFPINYLLIEALERYYHYYGDNLKVECPTGSGHLMNLKEVAQEISTRLTKLFLPDESGHRPFSGSDSRFQTDPHWKDHVLFHEYFHAETGKGLGASHQTGWTALVIRLMKDLARDPKAWRVSGTTEFIAKS